MTSLAHLKVALQHLDTQFNIHATALGLLDLPLESGNHRFALRKLSLELSNTLLHAIDLVIKLLLLSILRLDFFVECRLSLLHRTGRFLSLLQTLKNPQTLTLRLLT